MGRTNGQFLPQDPLAYRREKKNEKNQSLFDSNYSYYAESKVIADSTSDLMSYDSKSSQPYKNNGHNIFHRTFEKSYYNPNLLSQPKSKAVDNIHPSSNDPFHAFAQTQVRLEELNISLNRYYPQHIACKILGLASYHVSQGNDDILEKVLTSFRRLELYRGNSVDKSMAIRPLDFALSQSKPDKNGEEVSRNAYEQASAKLSEIEEVLRPYCAKEFIENVIIVLIEQCSLTGNYDILDEALERHKNNVKRMRISTYITRR